MKDLGLRILIAVILVCASLSVSAQDKPSPQTYAITVCGTSGVTAGKSVTGTVIVEDYSTNSEVSELAGVLKAKGRGLVSAMGKIKAIVLVSDRRVAWPSPAPSATR